MYLVVATQKKTPRKNIGAPMKLARYLEILPFKIRKLRLYVNSCRKYTHNQIWPDYEFESIVHLHFELLDFNSNNFYLSNLGSVG